MNKGAKRRAFFVTLFLCVIYLFVFMKWQDKIGIGRTAAVASPVAQNMSLGHGVSGEKDEEHSEAIETKGDDEEKDAGKTPVVMPAKKQDNRDFQNPDEPSLFIAVPLVVHALRQGWIEKEGLIPVSDPERCRTRWRKAEEILLDKDEAGLAKIGTMIGRKRLVEVLQQEGIKIDKQIPTDEIISGRGYSMEKEKVLALFTKHVTSDYDRLFPYTVRDKTITRTSAGFQFVQGRRAAHQKSEKDVHEWVVPDVVNMSVKSAIEKMAAHTAHVKVYGSGTITDQRPKAFERTKGEAEIILFGRAQKR